MTGSEEAGIYSSSRHRKADHAAHAALIHRGPEALLAAAVAFIDDGLAADEPTMAIFPTAMLERLRSRLGSSAGRVRLEDMTVVGRNPARLLPLILEFAEAAGGSSRIIGQPLWGGRSDPEVAEVMCHEALVNLALAERDARVVCAYDLAAADERVAADVRRTHPQLVSPHGKRSASADYAGPSGADPDPARGLEEPRPPVEEIPVTPELRSLRQRVASSALTAPLSGPRRDDFVLAVNEAAINALEHGQAPRAARLWRKGGSVIAEVVARGRVDDPLVGRRTPEAHASRGRGLWIVNQLCDLVQLRHEGPTTKLRLHVDVT
ncbi:MAG TPA: sensor histidine kinase [Solirubrobacteraceae bacterium]